MRILMLALLLGASPILAQDTDEQEESVDQIVAPDPANEDPGPPPTGFGASETARQNKKTGVELGYGLLVGAVSGVQFHPYYNIMPNLSVGLLYGSGSFDVTSVISDEPGIKYEEATLGADIIMAHGRFFVGNSFFVNFGLGQRNIKADINVQSTSIDYGLKGAIEASSMSLMLGIGNQWQWDSGFSLGVEWLGYIVPVSSSSSSSVDETGGVASSIPESEKKAVTDAKKDMEEVAEAIGELSSPRLFMISVGWLF